MNLKLFLVNLQFFGISFGGLINSAFGNQNWEFDVINVEYDINVDYITADFEIKRIKRGEYAVNGSYTFSKELSGDAMVCKKVSKHQINFDISVFGENFQKS